MPSVADMVLRLTGKDESASKTVDAVKEKTNGLGSAIKGIGSIASGVAIGNAIPQLAGFFTSAAKAAGEDEASTLRLRTAINNTGTSFDSMSGQVNDVIKAGQDLGFTDDQTRDSLSNLAGMTGNAGEAIKRYGLAQDLARGRNLDLVTASNLLGKVTDENVTALQRYGVRVEKGASETELFAAVYEKFHGQAQTFADSTAGKMARFQDQMGELKESIGYAVLPVMTALANVALTKVAPALSSVIGVLGPMSTYLQEVVQGGDTLNDFLTNIDPRFQGLAKTIGEVILVIKDQLIPSWVEGFKTLLDAATPVVEYIVSHKEILIAAIVAIGVAIVVALGPGSAAVLALVALPIAVDQSGAAFARLRQTAETEWAKVPAPVQRVLEFFEGDVESRIQAFVGLVKSYFSTLSDGIGVVLDLIHGRWGEAWDGIKSIASTGAKAVLDVVDSQMAGLPRLLAGVAEDAGQKFLDALQSAWDKVPGSIKSALGDVSRLLYDVGRDMVQGLWDGLKSLMPSVGSWLSDQVTGLASKAMNAIKSHSPSKVWEGIGQNMVAGLAQGLTGAQNLSMPLPPAPAGAYSGGQGGGITINLNAPVYGMDDFNNQVRGAVTEGLQAGAFRGYI